MQCKAPWRGTVDRARHQFQENSCRRTRCAVRDAKFLVPGACTISKGWRMSFRGPGPRGFVTQPVAVFPTRVRSGRRMQRNARLCNASIEHAGLPMTIACVRYRTRSRDGRGVNTPTPAPDLSRKTQNCHAAGGNCKDRLHCRAGLPTGQATAASVGPCFGR